MAGLPHGLGQVSIEKVVVLVNKSFHLVQHLQAAHRTQWLAQCTWQRQTTLWKFQDYPFLPLPSKKPKHVSHILIPNLPPSLNSICLNCRRDQNKFYYPSGFARINSKNVIIAFSKDFRFFWYLSIFGGFTFVFCFTCANSSLFKSRQEKWGNTNILTDILKQQRNWSEVYLFNIGQLKQVTFEIKGNILK